MKRSLRWLPAGVLVLLLLLITAPLSALGSRVLISVLDSFNTLDIEYGHGTLIGDLHLTGISLHTSDVSLRLVNLDWTLNGSCLWQSKLCFSRLRAASLRVDIAAGEVSLAKDDTPAANDINVPFPIALEHLDIADTQVHWLGGSLQAANVSMAGVIDGRHISLSRSEASEAHLKIEDGQDEPRQNSLQLPAIDLPLQLVIDNFSLARSYWEFGGQKTALDAITLRGSWERKSVAVEVLSIVHPQWGDLTAAGDVKLAEHWPFSIVGSLKAAPLSYWSQQLQQLEVELLTPLAFTAAGDLQQQRLHVTAAAQGLGYMAAELDIRARLAGQQLTLDNLSLGEKTAPNALLMTGGITLAPALSGQFKLRANEFVIPQFNDSIFGVVSGQAEAVGEVSGDQWFIALSKLGLTGDVNNLPATVEGSLHVASGMRIGRSALEANLNGLKLQVRSDTEQPDQVSLQMTAENIGRWIDDTSGALSLHGAWDSQTRQLSWQGGVESIAIARLQVDSGDISGKYYWDEPERSELKLSLVDLKVAQGELDYLQATLANGKDQQTLTVATQGDITTRLQFEGSLQGEDWRGRLLPANVVSPVGTWQLENALAIDWSTDTRQLQIDEHCWHTAGAALCSELWQVGETGGGGGTLHGDLQFLGDLIHGEFAINGLLDATLKAAWSSPEDLKLVAQIQLDDGELTQRLSENETAELTWKRLQASAVLDNGELRVEADLARQQEKIAKLSLVLPTSDKREIDGQLTLNAIQLQILRPFTPQLEKLRGNLDGTLQLTGTLDRPLVHGTMLASEVTAAMVGFPTELELMKLELRAEGDKAYLLGTASLGGGDTKITGFWHSVEEVLTIQLAGERHHVTLPPSLSVVVSEKLNMMVFPDRLNMTGNLVVHEGQLKHDQLPQGSVALSDDVVELDYRGEVVRERQRLAASIDVNILIEDDFRIEGSGINASVAGDLHLLQTLNRPLQLFGVLNVLGGEINVYGQRLEVKRGSVNFSGPPENPELNVRAERYISGDDLTVGVAVQGALDVPLLEIYSDPQLEQTEAMSYLVRGRGLDAGAGGGGAELALSAGASLANRSGIISGLNELPGFNNIAFGSDGTADDTTATISGYLGERLYLSYGVGIYQPINVLIARLYLQTQLWLEVVSSLENSLDIYYSFDIE